jgi:hypothetical protein
LIESSLDMLFLGAEMTVNARSTDRDGAE